MEDEDHVTSCVPIQLEHFTAAALPATFFQFITALTSMNVLQIMERDLVHKCAQTQ